MPEQDDRDDEPQKAEKRRVEPRGHAELGKQSRSLKDAKEFEDAKDLNHDRSALSSRGGTERIAQ